VNFFIQQPEDLDYSMPLEPMRLEIVGEQDIALKSLISSLVDSDPTKLTKDQRHKLRDCYRGHRLKRFSLQSEWSDCVTWCRQWRHSLQFLEA